MPTNPTIAQRTVMRSSAGTLLLGLLAYLSLFLATIGTAAAEQPVLQRGNAIVTGFSGTAPGAGPTAGDPVDNEFIDLNGASARILDLSNAGQPPQGQLINAPNLLQIKAGDVGQVFGVTFDDGKGPDGTLSGPPDIYLAASSAFGLQIVVPDAGGQLKRAKAGQPGAQWMAGQWGPADKNGSPGSIWKVSGNTGEVTLFTNVALNGQPNSGPGLGSIAFDPKTRQLFVSDAETGMIHRIDMRGTDLGFYDHGSQGRVGQGLAPVPYDPASRLDITSPAFNVNDAATWHLAAKARQVTGLKVLGNRLFYATAEGPQVWSIGIEADGSFGNDQRLEIDLAGSPTASAITSLTSDEQGYLYLAQRGDPRGDYTYKVFAEPKSAAALRYKQEPSADPAKPARWVTPPEEYALGFPPDFRNGNGGLALGYGYDQSGHIDPASCGKFVWMTGDSLRQGSGLGEPQAVTGLQGMSRDLVRPANAPPAQSYFADLDGKFDDADSAGHAGNLKIWEPCEPQQAAATTVQPAPQPQPLPQPRPQPLPLPPVQGGNLSLTKAGSDCVARNNAPDFDCNFTITITNTGSTTFQGPLQVDDQIGTKFGSPTFDPAWTCQLDGTDPQISHCLLPSAALAPGQSIVLNETMPVQHGDLSSTPCQLPNVAAIADPQGGIPANLDASDDQSTATSTINDPNCLQTPPPPPPTPAAPNLKISKIGDPCTKNGTTTWECNFVVTIANTGDAPFAGPLTIADTTTFGDVKVAPPWTCTNGADLHTCTNPAASIDAQSSITMPVTVSFPQTAITLCREDNSAKLVDPAGGTANNTDPNDDEAAATAAVANKNCPEPTNLSLAKSATPDCAKNAGGNFVCDFKITVTNTGPAAFNDTIGIEDFFPPFISFTRTGPLNWNCSGTPNGPVTGATCTSISPVPLASGASVDVNLHFEVPAADASPDKCKFVNTATITAPAGGAITNGSPADDNGTAIAKIPMVVDPVNGSVPCDPPSLKLSKVADPQICAPAKGGFQCSYKVTVTSTGPDPFHGPLTIDETLPAGATLLSASSPWTCTGGASKLKCGHAFVDIPVGQSLDLGVKVLVPAAAVKAGSCQFTNTANLAIAAGPLKGAKYQASASATVQSPQCAQTKPTEGHVTIEKTCSPFAADGVVSCRITVTNDGRSLLAGPLTFGDKGNWKGDNAPLQVSSVKPDDAALTCTGLPSNLSCTLPAKALPPGRSHSVSVSFAGGGPGGYHNCATIMSAGGAAIGKPSCVDGGSNPILVKKTAPANCGSGQDCTFQVTLTNQSDSNFTGAVNLGDLMYLGGSAAGGVAVTSISPPLGCAANALPFTCMAQITLAAHEAHVHAITVRMPTDRSAATDTVDGLNCFMAVNGADSKASAQAQGQAALQKVGDGPGYSCVAFKLRNPQKCPGDLVRVGTQCKCPDGTKPTGNYKCGGTTLPPTLTCQPPMLGTYPNCYLPKCKPPTIGTYPNCYLPSCPTGTTGTYPDCRKLKCRPPMVGTYPNCYLPKCPAGTAGTYPNCNPLNCTPPMVGTYPNCYLPKCQPPMVGTYPNCYLPKCPAGTAGTYPNCNPLRCTPPMVGTYPNCYLPKCQPPMTGTYPNCYLPRCPAGTVGTYPNCNPLKCRPPMIGNYPNCYLPRCPAGTTGVYPNCVKAVCPPGTMGMPPLCIAMKCPRGTQGVFPNCTKIPQQPTQHTCPQGYRVLQAPNKYGAYCEIIPVPTQPTAPSNPCGPGMYMSNGQCYPIVK